MASPRLSRRLALTGTAAVVRAARLVAADGSLRELKERYDQTGPARSNLRNGYVQRRA